MPFTNPVEVETRTTEVAVVDVGESYRNCTEVGSPTAPSMSVNVEVMRTWSPISYVEGMMRLLCVD